MTYDLSITQNNKVGAGFGNSGQLLTGVLRVSQQFTNRFLTEVGSQTYRDTYGTEFMLYLKNGIIRTDNEVESYFNQAVADTLYQMNQLYTGDEPDDERHVEVQLQNFQLDEEYLTLYIVLTTADGTDRTISVPISVVEA